jgi:hypothetical protein
VARKEGDKEEMKTVVIKRRPSIPMGTFGVLSVNNLILFTVELPWKDNQNNQSCVPKGKYRCSWTRSPRLKKYTYEVMGVPKRAGIRIHSANFASQVLGCISLGEKIGIMDGKRGVFSSVSAVRRFEKLLDKQEFILEVR